MPVSDMNEAVLRAIEQHALTPEAIESVVRVTERDDVAERQSALYREAKDLDQRIARLVVAVETAEDVASLATKLRELEARRREVSGEISTLRPIPRLAPTVLSERLEEWRRMLRASRTQARSVLQRIVVGRITFTPREEGDGMDFHAQTRYDRLFRGICVPRASEVGETVGVEDLLDQDYGELLEALLTGNGSRARQDSNLRPPA